MARTLGIEIFFILLIGLVLGLFGPFGTFEIAALPRVLLWMSFVLTGYAFFRPTIVAAQWLSDALHIAPIIATGLALVIAAVPVTALIALMFSGFDLERARTGTKLGELYFQVWLIGFLINGLIALLFRDAALPSSNVARTPAPPEAAVHDAVLQAVPSADLHDRLPAGFGRLLALKGEDHYVRVIGEARDVMILLRLRDAITLLPGHDGLQVHRSWWVARAAVAGSVRDGRALRLRLSNGSEVPVAREKIAALTAAGWL